MTQFLLSVHMRSLHNSTSVSLPPLGSSGLFLAKRPVTHASPVTLYFTLFLSLFLGKAWIVDALTAKVWGQPCLKKIINKIKINKHSLSPLAVYLNGCSRPFGYKRFSSVEFFQPSPGCRYFVPLVCAHPSLLVSTSTGNFPSGLSDIIQFLL